MIQIQICSKRQDTSFYSVFPGLPEGVALFPQLIEMIAVPGSIHASPRAGMFIDHELAFAGDYLQRSYPQVAVIVGGEIIENALVENEKPPVYEFHGRFGLLVKGLDLIVLDIQFPETRCEVDPGYGGHLAQIVR